MNVREMRVRTLEIERDLARRLACPARDPGDAIIEPVRKLDARGVLHGGDRIANRLARGLHVFLHSVPRGVVSVDLRIQRMRFDADSDTRPLFIPGCRACQCGLFVLSTAHDQSGRGIVRASIAPSAVMPAIARNTTRYARSSCDAIALRSLSASPLTYAGPPSITCCKVSALRPPPSLMSANRIAPVTATPTAPPTARESAMDAVALPSDSRPAAS